MKQITGIILIILFLIVLTVKSEAACPKIENPAQTGATPLKPANPEQPRYALLVGVGKYKNEQIKPLDGAPNDVALLKDVLVNNFGFKDDAEHIKTLCSEEATRDAITNAFRDLIKKVAEAKKQEKNPIVVFHFSGHGSQFLDQDGDEKGDGWDETILPYDARTGDVFDIIDDELEDFLNGLSEHSSNVVFIADSCHSGTITRGEFVAREVARDLGVDSRKKEPYKRKYPTNKAEKYVSISAALSNQRAYERPKEFAGAMKNGELTFHLSAALRRATRSTRWSDLMSEVGIAVRSEMPYQDPNIEGDKSDDYVFDGSAAKPLPTIAIEEVREVKNDKGKAEKVVIFAAGLVHGVRIGTQVAIYDESETEFRGNKNWLSNAIVSEVNYNKAVAKLPKEADHPNVSKINVKSRLILSMPTQGGTAVSLVLTGTGANAPDAEIAAAVKEKLQNNILIEGQLLEISESIAAAKAKTERSSPILRLKRAKFKDAFVNRKMAVLPAFCMSDKDLLPDSETEIYYLDDGSGDPLLGQFFTVGNPRSAENIVNFINYYAQYRTLQTIENENSALSYAINAAIEVLPKNVSYACQTKGTPRRDARKENQCANQSGFYEGKAFANLSQILEGKELPQGAAWRLKIQNISNKPVFVTAFYLGNDGSIVQIYPNPLKGRIEQIEPNGWSNDEIARELITTQPTGKELIKIIITPGDAAKPEFKFLETPSVRDRGDSPLKQLLSKSGQKTRGEILQPDKPDNWGVVTLDYFVTDKWATCSQ